MFFISGMTVPTYFNIAKSTQMDMQPFIKFIKIHLLLFIDGFDEHTKY